MIGVDLIGGIRRAYFEQRLPNWRKPQFLQKCEFACNIDPLRGVFASNSDPL